MLGYPARAAGRFPVIVRYIWGGRSTLNAADVYVSQRFHGTISRRRWLLLDAAELELIERLINEGSDEEVFSFRRAQLESGASTTVVVSSRQRVVSGNKITDSP